MKEERQKENKSMKVDLTSVSWLRKEETVAETGVGFQGWLRKTKKKRRG